MKLTSSLLGMLFKNCLLHSLYHLLALDDLKSRFDSSTLGTETRILVSLLLDKSNRGLKVGLGFGLVVGLGVGLGL
jgi:hypothetical protein